MLNLLKYTVIVSFFCSFSSLKAQDNGDNTELLISTQFKAKRVIPPSPDAAALGKYGNQPVSMFSGTPQVQVPLFQIGKDVPLAIDLSYSGGGFNPQEIASWVGLGWSLNAGGVITRSVMGNPDIYSNYFGLNPSMQTPPVNDQIALNQYYDSVRKGHIEVQPDTYFFKFGTYSGKFAIKPDQTVVFKEKNNFKISHCITCGPPESTFFTITDDKGYTFEFRAVEVSTFTPDDLSTDIPLVTYTYPSSWYLTSITSPNGIEQIIFDYHNVVTDHYQYQNFFQNQSAIYESTTTYNSAGVFSSPFSGPAFVGSGTPVVRTKKKYLDKVSVFRGGAMIQLLEIVSVQNQRQDFGHNWDEFPGERMPTEIKLSSLGVNSSMKLEKRFTFSFGYFQNQNFPTSWRHKRLRLQAVQEVAVDGATSSPPSFVFDYFDNTFIPSLSTVGIDHWGFYNTGDVLQGGSLVPTSSISNGSVVVTGANRAPVFTGARLCMLRRITYPTRGYTEYEYEPHMAKNPGEAQIEVGGIRIRRITDFSFQDRRAVERIFRYTLADDTTQSSGLCAIPVYMSGSVFRSFGSVPGFPGSGGNGWSQHCAAQLVSEKITVTVSANSIVGLGTMQGSHIGYSRVAEMIRDVNTQQPLGETVHEFYTEDGFQQGAMESVANGTLLRKQIFDNSGKLVEEHNFHYDYPLFGSIGGSSAIVSAFQDNKNMLVKVRDNTTGTVFFGWYLSIGCVTVGANNNFSVLDSRFFRTKFSNGGGWGLTCRQKQLTQQVVRKFDQVSNAYLTTTTNYTFGNNAHIYPTKIAQSVNASDTLVTEKRYPLDYITTGQETGAEAIGIAFLQAHNIVSETIETVQYRQGVGGSNKRYVTGLLQSYEGQTTLPTGLFRLELAAPTQQFVPSSIVNGAFQRDANFKQFARFRYNSGGNIIEQSKMNDAPTAYVWDYHGALPTAEVVGASSDAIAYTSFETGSLGNWNNIPNLPGGRLPGGVTGIYAYQLSPGVAISRTTALPALPASQSYTVSYWSNNGPLTIIPAPVSSRTGSQNVNGFLYFEHTLPASATTVQLSKSAGALIDELRLFPNRSLITTYTYDDYSGTITTQCSPQNKITRYEYDGLSRVTNLRDGFGNIVKNFQYNFGLGSALTPSAQTLFYNNPAQTSLIPNNCPPGTVGAPVVYRVPYGRYASSISQADANSKASADLLQNGQAFANQNGLCYWWNDQQSAMFFKNNCEYFEGPPSPQGVTYTVPANTYSSLVSKQDANNKALADIAANGQNFANQMGSCSCTQPGYRFVNGQCEQGTMVSAGYVFWPGCQGNKNYRCYYYYVFSDGSTGPVYYYCSATPCADY